MRKNLLSPSLLAADFSRLAEDIRNVEEAGAQYLHLDVMDGAFVPSISFGMPVIQSLRKISNMTFDVHLMIENPDRYLDEFAAIGADILTVHGGGLYPSGPHHPEDSSAGKEGRRGSEPGDSALRDRMGASGSRYGSSDVGKSRLRRSEIYSLCYG